MSLCGMVLTVNGIVAFADSKATIKNWLGADVEDKDRKPHKILKNPDIIIVTTGTNQYLNEYDEYINLEDGIESLIQQYSIRYHKIHRHDLEWLFLKIKEILLKTLERNQEVNYQFLVGYNEGTYKVATISINPHEQSLVNPKIADKNFYQYGVIGDEVYCQIFKGILFEKQYSINELPHVMKNIMHNLIAINTDTRVYNPVGLPIHVEIFQ